jgi:hypothetical protein
MKGAACVIHGIVRFVDKNGGIIVSSYFNGVKHGITVSFEDDRSYTYKKIRG